MGRCEFGWEIIIAVAHLIYDLGISLDKPCSILDFFQDLPLRKSQAEALRKQLARLRLYLSKYTLKTVIAETLRCLQTGRSCFEEQLQKLKLKLPPGFILQQLYPMPQPTG